MKGLLQKLIKKPITDGDGNGNLLTKLGVMLAYFSNSRLILTLTGISLFFLAFVTFMIHHQSKAVSALVLTENNQANKILSQMNDINDELQQLTSTSQNAKQFKETLANISQNLSNVAKSIDELAKSSDIQKVSSQIASMQNDMNWQISDLRQVISTNSKQYLNSKVLPFHVISVDVIALQPFVSIDYKHQIAPFTVGDSIAGWQITAADYSSAEVEFKNDHNQYVKISLQG